MQEARPDPALARLRAALDAAGDAIVVVDEQGRIVHANTTALRVAGHGLDEVVGVPILEVAIADGAEDTELEGIRTALAGAPTAYPLRRAERRVTVRTRPLAGGGTVFVSQSVAAYHEQDLRVARDRLFAIIGRALSDPDRLEAALAQLADELVPRWGDGCVVVLADPDGSLRAAAARHPDPDFVRIAVALLPDRIDAGAPGGLLARAAAARAPVVVDHEVLDPVAPAVRAQLQSLGLRGVVAVPLIAEDELVGLLVLPTTADASQPLSASRLDVLRAVGDRTAEAIRAARMHSAMRAAESRFRAAFVHAPIGIALSRTQGRGELVFTDVNPAFCTIAGYPREVLVGRRMSEFTHPEDRDAERRRFGWLVDRRADETTAEKRMVSADGEVRWVLARSAQLDDGSVVTQLQDVTERRRFESQLEHLASHDALTGLLNRRRLEEAVEQELANVRRHGDSAAVLTLDVDNFKSVNDTYGHAAGDAVLQAVAQALQSRVRATDQVGRLGGDEFGVVLARTSTDDARAVAAELLQAVRELRVDVEERKLRVTASIGLRALRATEARGADVVLSEADMAMYDAKERGRDRVSVISPGDLEPERVRARTRFSERIRDALEADDGFRLYEQPIMRLADDTIDRSEVLLRMVGEDGEIIPPARFLPVAERYGQVQAIDRWVVRRALALLAERDAAGHHAALEVNLSGDSLSDPTAVDYFIAAIGASGVDPARLIFEVTETTAIGNLDHARALVERLTALGCGFALDDFGAGFGSFAYLKHLPLGVVKIDGQFIRGLWDSRHDQITVRAMVDVARGLGKETVAEYVGDQATCDLLRSFGVDRAQGEFIGMPVPAGTVPALRG